ncbi:hypothetical protein MAR_025910, partial [Mya arenaria]
SGIGKRNPYLRLSPRPLQFIALTFPQRSAMHDAFMPGSRFLTVDLGGGRADLSTMEVLGDGSLKKLCCVQGQLVGGQNVNEVFLQSCHENFEVAIGNECPVDELITVPLPKTVRESISIKSIKLNPKKDKGFEAEDDELKFRSTYIRDSLLQQICHVIFDAIDRVLQQNESSDKQAVVL